MSKFLCLTVAGWVMLSVFTLSAQVTISPAIGISYFPFKFSGANTQLLSRQANLLLGVSARLPIHEDWSVKARVSYTDREDWTWRDNCQCPGYQYNKYQHSDLNLDFSVNYAFNKYLSLGTGPMFIRKLNTFHTLLDFVISPDEILHREERFEYGVQLTAIFSLGPTEITLEYARKLYNYELDFYALKGRNRYNAVLAVPVRLKKRQR